MADPGDIAIGIDLGTSYSCVSILENGQTSVIPNEWGERTHASVVSFLEDGTVLVGNSAKRNIITNADNTNRTITYNYTGSAVTLTAKLPIVQEMFTRTFHIVNGENVVYVDSQLENLLGFDRPVNWAEHATIMAPFLQPRLTSIYL